MIHFNSFWSIMIHFNLFWSIMIHFDPFSIILIQFDPFWFDFIHRLPGVTGADKINLLNGGSYQKVAISGSGSGSTSGLDKAMTSKSMDMGTFIEKDGSIEVPGKGWCFVHISRYSYDPFQHSPNDSPEAELQVWMIKLLLKFSIKHNKFHVF